MKSLALIAVVIAVVSAGFEHQAQFDSWKTTNGKRYESSDIELGRQLIWESNKNYVENHNKFAAKQFGFTVEMNEFADMETSEFKEMYNGLVARGARYVSPQKHEVNGSAPASIDWRDKNVVTAVKNQGQCGSCWSFSTTGSLEGQHALKTGKLVSLSEQQLMDCSTKEGNHGCKGGLMDFAFKYLETVKGDDTEESYPYKAEDGVCHYEPSNVGAGVSGYTDVTRGSEAELMDAVGTVGPISIAMDAGHKSFQLYKSGVYSEPECSSTKLDHGVLAIGYGTYEGEAFWLVKNSWGPAWGMEGFFMSARNKDNMCGLATQASYPTGVN